ncbi:PIN domain-containing protein [Candidatus Woesearchaeota archaeon]|nr:PIN domain-containing protein [Candidatus Woesearchaeota archaeon]
MEFYVDTNIYLNLWKKEGDSTKGTHYWKLAQDFMDKAERDNSIIAFSGLILKELKYKLTPEQFKEKSDLLKSTYKKVDVLEEDYDNARKLESKSGFDISFYDCLHIAVCKRLNLVLVTRDRLMLDFAKSESLKCGKPEEFL